MEYQHIIFFISSGIQSSLSLVRMRPWNSSRYFWQLSVKWIPVKLSSALFDRVFWFCSLSRCLKDRMQEINWFICLFGALLNDKNQMEIQICWNSINCAWTIYWRIFVIQKRSSLRGVVKRSSQHVNIYGWFHFMWLLTVEITLTAHIKLGVTFSCFILFFKI